MRIFLERLVDIYLQMNHSTTSPAAIASDHARCLRVFEPILDRISRKPTKNHRVHRTNTRTREHRDGRLSNHGHVDKHAVF